jgi:16S rRNA (uracil1498-N3)-methyltransferase
MRSPRVFVAEGASEGVEVELSREESRHLDQVLRRGIGDRVLVLCGGSVFEATICQVSERTSTPRIRVRLGPAVEDLPPAPTPWTIAVALAKGDAIDLAVRLASELGLAALVPVETARTAVRLGGGGGRRERWERISREAAKQCGRPEPLRIEEGRTLGTFLEQWRALARPGFGLPEPGGEPLGFVAHPGGPFHPGRLLRGRGEGLPPAVFLIGPEGGLSPKELGAAVQSGLAPLGFPTPILRTATAVAFLGALGAVLGSRGEIWFDAPSPPE